MNMSKFNMIRDINGYNGFGLQFTGIEWQGVLKQGLTQSITIPGSPYADYSGLLLIFSFAPGSSIWVAQNATATAPTTTIALCNSELNPTARQVYAEDIISFATNDVSDEYGAILYAITGSSNNPISG
jgi:hypothetical protein